MCDKNIWDAQISILKNKYSVSILSLKNISTVDDAVQKIVNKNKKKNFRYWFFNGRIHCNKISYRVSRNIR